MVSVQLGSAPKRQRTRSPASNGIRARTDRAGNEDERERAGQKLPEAVRSEITASVRGSQRDRVLRAMGLAAESFARGRYTEALKVLQPVAGLAPEASSVRELLGLTFYRLGRWREASRHLGAYHRITGSYDQYPALADCYRAMGHHRKVEELCEELRRADPPPDCRVEGRLVLAGSRADRGDLKGAIAVLDTVPNLRHPAERHLRQWYALADLYERAGEIGHARDLFARVVRYDAQAWDAAERLAALS